MLQLQFPVHECLVHLHPVLVRGRIIDLHGYAPHILLVAGVDGFGDDILLVDILLQGKEYLVGVDGLDEVVGNLGSYGLVHDVLLLALGHHHHRQGGMQLLDTGKCLQPGESRHILVEQDEVVAAFATAIQGITPIRGGIYLILFPLEEEDVRTQQFYLIVNPK